MNDEIPEDTSEITTLSVAQAEKLVQRGGQLALNGITSISDDVAQVLSKHTGGTLSLDGLTELSDTAAEALAHHSEEIYFESLTKLTNHSLAAKLAPYFWFPNVQMISPAAATAVVEAVKNTEHAEVCLDAVTSLTAEAARALACHKGYLSLDGLTILTEDVAEALAAHEGSLSLTGLTSISASAAMALSQHRGDVDFENLASLSSETAHALASIGFSLFLHRLPTISDDAAVALGQHKGTLILDGIESLSPVAAAGLAANDGPLYLRGLKILSAAAAMSLSKHKDWLGLGLTSITDETARALAKHGGGLGLDELTSLTDAAAQHLSRYRGWCLSLGGLTNLSAKSAAALARRKAEHPYIAKLCFHGLKSLPTAVAEALARFKGNLYLSGVEELSDTAAAHLALHDGFLSMRGLTTLSDLAAARLGQLAEIEVDEAKWPESAAARFREARLEDGDKREKVARRHFVPLLTDGAAVAMDESAVRSTLVLRDVIAAAPSILAPIGSYTILFAGSSQLTRQEFVADSDAPRSLRSDVEWTVGDYLASLPIPDAPPFASDATSPEDPDATWIRLYLDGCPAGVALDEISADALRRIYDAAAPAAFGDMKAMETRIDPLVRAGREIDANGFRVSRALCEWVRRTWNDHFVPESIRVEPYKINLYAPGDRFAMHRDTPEKNLVGTFLLALSGWGPPCGGGGLVVHDSSGVFRWNGASGWAAFVPYLPHEVEPVTSGARVTMAFKVYASSDQESPQVSPEDELLLEEIANRVALCRNERGQVGILLKYAYSLNGTALCGSDRFIFRALERLGKIQSIPVAVHVKDKARDVDAWHWRASAQVYALTPENLTAVAKHAGQPSRIAVVGEAHIPFIAASGGHSIYRTAQDAVEWVGNYAEPANVDTLYVHRALIVTSPADSCEMAIRCPNADFARTDLSGHDLRLADLQGANFFGASLACANLQQAFLANVDLTSANLRGADLNGVDLACADLTNAQLLGANLSDASLQEVCLEGVAWDEKTVWPEGFDPLQHGAAPMQQTQEKEARNASDAEAEDV